MALAASAFTWVRVSSGVWTRIYSGPLVALFPHQVLEMSASGSPLITFTLDGYSAAPPFYGRFGGTARASFAGSPPVGSTGSWAAILSFHTSPWAEFLILTNRACFAHLAWVI